MTELNRSELPVTRDTKDLFSKSFLNFSNNRPQKFVVLTILTYFGTKIFNNFFNVYTSKTNTQETLDLLSTIVLSALLFYLTGLNTRPTLGIGTAINLPFYIGILLGTTEALFEYKVITPMKANNQQGYISLKIFLITICCAAIIFNIFLSRTVSAQNYPSTSNYLIYIFVIASILAALYYSKMTNVVCDGPSCPPDIPINPSPDNPSCPTEPNTKPSDPDDPNSPAVPTVLSLKTSKFNISFGLVAWLMALTFLYDSTNPLYHAISSFLFGLFTGTYISNFSTFGMKYMVQSNTTINDTTPIKPSQLTSALSEMGIKTTDKYDIFNKIDGNKYKTHIDTACKIVIDDKLVMGSKNAKSLFFFNCVKDKIVIDGKHTITFYVNKVSYTKIAIFIILCLASLALLTYIVNKIIPLVSM